MNLNVRPIKYLKAINKTELGKFKKIRYLFYFRGSAYGGKISP